MEPYDRFGLARGKVDLQAEGLGHPHHGVDGILQHAEDLARLVGFDRQGRVIHVRLLRDGDTVRQSIWVAEDARPGNRDRGLQPPCSQLHIEALEEGSEGNGEHDVRGGVARADPQERQYAPAATADHEPGSTVPVCQCGPPSLRHTMSGKCSAAEVDLVGEALGSCRRHAELAKQLQPLRDGEHRPKGDFREDVVKSPLDVRKKDRHRLASTGRTVQEQLDGHCR
jgi:hypothetical protein